MGREKNLAFLQSSRHVRRNRNGFVCHHLVLTASGLLVGLSFERYLDTTESTIKRIIMSQFFATQGGNLQLAVPDMSFLRAFGDRAYQIKSLLEHFFLRGGAGIHGTIARNLRNPFTFDQKLKEGDERTNVPTTGGKTLFIKEAVVHGIPLQAFAFRNGYKGVILTISSIESGYDWDCVLKDPGDYQWYKQHQQKLIPYDEVLRRSFHPALGSNSTNKKAPAISDDMVNAIMAAPIQPTTMVQRGADWFNNRGMSLTSRSVEQGVGIFSGDENELDHGASWVFIKNYVAVAGLRSYSLADEDEESKEEDGNGNGGTGGGEQQGEHQQDEENKDDDDDDEYTIDVDRLLKDDPDYVDEVIDRLQSMPSYSDELVKTVLTRIGASMSAAQTELRRDRADRKKFEAWLNLPALLRPVYFQTAAKLRAFAKSLLPICPLPAKASEAVAQNSLVEHLTMNPLTTVDCGAQEVSTSSLIAQLTKKQRLMRSFIVAAFLPKLATEERRDTKRGLDLEAPMVRNLLRDSAKQKTIFEIQEVASAPLVCRNGLHCPSTNQPIHSACCSLDFAATIRHPLTGKHELAGIECKGRVKPATAAAQTIRFKKAKDHMGISHRDTKYVAVEAMGEAFSYFVTVRKEALQLLHHAFCYDFEHVLILVSDTHANIICGVWVHFSEELKMHWQNVLFDMHNLGLAYAYKQDGTNFMSEDDVRELEQVLQTVQVADGPLDNHTFLQWLEVWRKIRLEHRLPLPPIVRIVPRVVSSWNPMKGGSDTISKLMRLCMYRPPSKRPQAHAIARILGFALVNIHRLNQVATAKSGDVRENYKSLPHYRHAANERFSFSKTLLAVSKCSALTEATRRQAAMTNTTLPQPPHSPDRGIKLSANPTTGKTPQRNVMKKLHALATKDPGTLTEDERIILQRRVNCPGCPCVTVDFKGTCAVCQKATSSYCLGCHLHCHFDNEYEAGLDKMKINIPDTRGEDGKSIHCKYSCYWYLHAERLQQLQQQTND
jgi:hypothetical protein